jgi:outer membrane protein
MPPRCTASLEFTGGARHFGLAAWRAGAIVLVGLTAGWGASAQSLPELYEAARGYDAAYLAALAQTESAKYRAAQSDALKRPNVGLSAGATQTEADPPTAFTTIGSGQQVAVPGSGDRRSTTNLQAGVSATHPLYNAASDVTISQAQRTLDIASADLQVAEQDLIVRVAQAYFDVLAAQDALTTAQTNKRAISEQLASAKRNFEVGTATITDTREAQARFDLAGAQELAAENDLQTKRITLDVVVGRNNIQPLPLVQRVVLPGVVPADVGAWVAAADEQHPNVRKARLALDIARLETEKARAAERFTVDLTGTVGSSYSRGTGTSAPGNTLSASVGVLLKMPLYTGGALQNRVKETIALEEKSRNDFDAARRGVAQATRQTYFGLNSQLAQVKALEAAESSSQLALEATQLGYKVGVRVNLDVLNAQTQLFTTKRDLAKARYDVVLNGLKLRQASGQLKAEDVNAVNALFAK